MAAFARSVIAYPSIRTQNPALLAKAFDIYQDHRIDFPEAYLAAAAETSGAGAVASFDRAVDRVPTITRIEP